jgi:hypothetical protein
MDTLLPQTFKIRRYLAQAAHPLVEFATGRFEQVRLLISRVYTPFDSRYFSTTQQIDRKTLFGLAA